MPELIWTGANMGTFLRWGNWAVAKVIMVLFDTGSLSDVGCTMRLVSGPAARRLLPHYTVKDNAFSPEMMLLSVVGGWRVAQIPVNFRTRGGPPGTTESLGPAVKIGLQMIGVVLSYRLRGRAIARRLQREGLAPQASWPAGIARPGGMPAGILVAGRKSRGDERR